MVIGDGVSAKALWVKKSDDAVAFRAKVSNRYLTGQELSGLGFLLEVASADRQIGQGAPVIHYRFDNLLKPMLSHSLVLRFVRNWEGNKC
ncbi:hypothetical protein AAC387_Pa07g2508 [Persea americana]